MPTYYACYGCFSPSATGVTVYVGGTWERAEPVRLTLCDDCRLTLVTRPWPAPKQAQR